MKYLGLLITCLLMSCIIYSKEVILPKPSYKGKVSVEEAIFNRRSVRDYKDEPLTLQEVSQLLWSAGGITCDGITGATRAYPSAGASYPIEIYVVVGKVTGLPAGVYHYIYQEHKLKLIKEGDLRKELMKASLNQIMMLKAPISIVLTAIYPRTTIRYGERGRIRYVSMDVGHSGENIHLQAEALGLGTVVVGAFNDDAVCSVLSIKNETPLYIMPVGRKK